MTVKEIIRYAKSGGLKPINSTNDDDLIDYINLGVIELNKRFNLNTKEIIIARKPKVQIYPLPTDTNYIQLVYSDAGKMLRINEEDTPGESVFTPSPFTLLVPLSVKGDKISVVYSASFPRLTDLEDKLELPDSVFEALLHYIAFQAKASIDSSINAESNAHWLRFEASVKNILELGVVHPNDMYYRGVQNVYA
jgi:hypothetical protein